MKETMKKVFVLGSVLLVLLAMGVFVSSADFDGEEVSPEIVEAVKKVAGEEIGEKTSAFIEDFVEKRGIDVDKINSVSQVDFDNLPKEVNIENVDDTNLAIYEVDYDEDGEDKQVFVISYSVEQLRSQGDIIVAHDKRQSLDFGHSGTMTGFGFLNTAAGVETSLEKGYVMAREGSITTISTNLEVLGMEEGSIEIVVYLNGVPVSFGNTLDSSTLGVKKDYDVQSKDTVRFEPGDVVSAYVRGEGDASWSDVITIVEITTIN